MRVTKYTMDDYLLVLDKTIYNPLVSEENKTKIKKWISAHWNDSINDKFKELVDFVMLLGINLVELK